MNFLVYLPLLLPALLTLTLKVLPPAARPEPAARLFAACAALTATVSGGCLALLALTALDDLPAADVRERTAGYPLPEPVPGIVAVAAGLLLAAAAWRGLTHLRRQRNTTAALHAAGTPNDGLLIADWDEPHAVAVPAARPGRSRGHVLVTSGLLRLLDGPEWAAVAAHEHAHLRRHHHRTVALAATAAAVNPLLRPVADAVVLLVERSADEDAAAVVGDRGLVARSIAKVAVAGGPRTAGALGAGGSSVVRRVTALTRPRGGWPWAAMALATAVVLGAAAAGSAALADFIRVVQIWLP